MFLYELAVELGERSVDLVEVARRLGWGELTAASPVSDEQVAILRGRANPAWEDPSLARTTFPGTVLTAPGPEVVAAVPRRSRGDRTQMAAVTVAVVVMIALFALLALDGGDGGGRPASTTRDPGRAEVRVVLADTSRST